MSMVLAGGGKATNEFLNQSAANQIQQNLGTGINAHNTFGPTTGAQSSEYQQYKEKLFELPQISRHQTNLRATSLTNPSIDVKRQNVNIFSGKVYKGND